MRSVADIFRSYAVLDESGRHVNGTDKMSNHNYGDAYEQIFNHSPLSNPNPRERIRLMMEVGVADGSSLLAWREIFPNAICVGLDIHAPAAAAGYDRVEFHLGNQRSKEDCDRAANGRSFDLIVDDATHLIDNTLLTLFWLWPYVRPGGLYVVEDGGLQDCERVKALFSYAEIVSTKGPFGGIEPLVVLRKPL